jgi:hypothetical protein
MSRDELIGGGGGAVVNADLKAARFHIENEILAHDGQSDKSEVAFAHDDKWVKRLRHRGNDVQAQPLVCGMTKKFLWERIANFSAKLVSGASI